MIWVAAPTTLSLGLERLGSSNSGPPPSESAGLFRNRNDYPLKPPLAPAINWPYLSGLRIQTRVAFILSKTGGGAVFPVATTYPAKNRW
jgi:hypothetical protein